MKKILFFILLIPAFANAQFTSDFLVYNPFNEPFTVYINNSAINRIPTNKLIVNELQPGNYFISIVFANATIQPITQNIYIPANALSSLKLIKNGNFYTTEISNPIAYNAINYNPNDPNIHPVPPTPQPPAPEPQTTQGGYCDYPMADNDFASALASIKSKSFDKDKLIVAKQITNSNCLTSNQVKQIMELFSFESEKLEFAKFAYTHTFDPENYYKVNDAFSFSSSISELNNYIKSINN